MQPKQCTKILCFCIPFRALTPPLKVKTFATVTDIEPRLAPAIPKYPQSGGLHDLAIHHSKHNLLFTFTNVGIALRPVANLINILRS